MQVELSLRKIDFPLPVELAPRFVAVAIIEKAYQVVKSSVDALARVDGAKVFKFQADAAVDDMVGRKGVRSCEFTAVSNGTTYGAYWSDGRSVRILVEGKFPVDLEEQRAFLPRLNAWSAGGKKLYSDADLKKFEADNPLKPKVYKDFQEMEKKDKNAVLAFLSWALRKGGKAGKAYGDLLDTQNLKEKDPARVSALKAVNEILKEYYKSF